MRSLAELPRRLYLLPTADSASVFPMALAQSILTADHVDAETGIPKMELRRKLDEGLTELARGEGIEMDDAGWDRLRSELRARRSSR